MSTAPTPGLRRQLTEHPFLRVAAHHDAGARFCDGCGRPLA